MKSVGFIVLVACGIVAWWLVKGAEGESTPNPVGTSGTSGGTSGGNPGGTPGGNNSSGISNAGPSTPASYTGAPITINSAGLIVPNGAGATSPVGQVGNSLAQSVLALLTAPTSQVDSVDTGGFGLITIPTSQQNQSSSDLVGYNF